MRLDFSSLAVTFFFSLFLPTFSLAEDTGRLSDGRAYRTDTNGYRLVDELAELQVSNEELKRQVNSLEDEISQKNTLLQSGKSACSIAPVTTPPGKAETSQLRPNCSAEALPLQQRINDLEAKLVAASSNALRAQTAERNLTNSVARLESELLSERSFRETSGSEAEKSLAAAKASASASALAQARELGEREERIARLTKEIASFQDALEKSEERLARVSAELSQATGELQLAKSKAAETGHSEFKATAVEALESEATPAQHVREVQVARAMIAQPSSGRVEADSQAKLALQKELKELQSLIVKRKDLYDSLTAKKRGVTIKLQPLKSSSGQSLDSLRSASASLAATDRAQTILTGIREIRSLVQDDISTIQRLAK